MNLQQRLLTLHSLAHIQKLERATTEEKKMDKYTRRERLAEYSSIVQSIADDLNIYKDSWGGNVDPWKMALEESKEKLDRLEEICEELKIRRPFLR